MTRINWNLAGGAQRGFENALSMGMQMGAQARQAREEREYKNALAQFDPSNPDTLKPIMETRPEVGLQLRGQVMEQQRERQIGDATVAAMNGDQDARQFLLRNAYDRWKGIDEATRRQIAEETTTHGNAARYALNQPDPRAVVQAYAQQTGDPEIAAIAQLPDNELRSALERAVFEADMVGELISDERPDYDVLPPGATLVNTRDPQAVSQFGQGAQEAIPTINSPEELQNLAPGSRYRAPDGSIRVRGGTGGNAGGGFQR